VLELDWHTVFGDHTESLISYRDFLHVLSKDKSTNLNDLRCRHNRIAVPLVIEPAVTEGVHAHLHPTLVLSYGVV
jgi:hypothetical protein